MFTLYFADILVWYWLEH